VPYPATVPTLPTLTARAERDLPRDVTSYQLSLLFNFEDSGQVTSRATSD
jgi:hypothetical protein